MTNAKTFFLIMAVLVNCSVHAQSNSNFIDEDNQYWIGVPDDYAGRSPTCRSIITSRGDEIILTFTQYKQNNFMATMIIPSKSAARLNPSGPYGGMLAEDHKLYSINYINFIESGNAVSYIFKSGPNTKKANYVYDRSKNIRYLVSISDSPALQDVIDGYKQKGLPGKKEVKCIGPI